MLLGAIVQVALELAALVILGFHQALARLAQVDQAGLQVGGQPHILEREPRLVVEIVEELLLDRRECLAAALPHRQRTKQLTLVTDRDGPVGAWYLRQDLTREADRGGRVRARGGGGPRPRTVAW